MTPPTPLGPREAPRTPLGPRETSTTLLGPRETPPKPLGPIRVPPTPLGYLETIRIVWLKQSLLAQVIEFKEVIGKEKFWK